MEKCQLTRRKCFIGVHCMLDGSPSQEWRQHLLSAERLDEAADGSLVGRHLLDVRHVQGGAGLGEVPILGSRLGLELSQLLGRQHLAQLHQTLDTGQEAVTVGPLLLSAPLCQRTHPHGRPAAVKHAFARTRAHKHTHTH